MGIKNYLFLFLFIFCLNYSKAEIIDNQTVINKEFGAWSISCREDMMLDKNDCKFFTEIIDGTTFFINPNNESNKIVLISREVLNNTKVIFRVDKNPLIESETVSDNMYNIVDINIENKNTLLNQMKNGKNLYIRFTVKDSSNKNGGKQITAKLDLADFGKAIIYYDSMIEKLL